LLPFVFFSALWGTWRLLGWLSTKGTPRGWPPEKARNMVAGLLLLAFFLFHDWSEAFHLRYYSIGPHHRRLYAALETIPPDASVSAQAPIAPHLSYRQELYHFPNLGPAGNPARFVVVDTTLTNRQTALRNIAEGVGGLPAKGYVKVFDENGILLFER